MVGIRAFDRIIGLVSTIILARLLVPEDFGLISLAAMAVGMIEMAGELGMEMALIRDQKARRSHYDTVWTIKIIIGVITSSTLAGLSGTIAVFFNEPRLESILYALAIALFASSFANVGTINFTKEMKFGMVFLQSATSRSTKFIITVSLALWWANYWALVAGIISSRLLAVVFSYIIHPYRPRLSLVEWREVLGFSKWVFVARIMTFIHKSTSRFVIGKLSDASAVGLFSVANELSGLVSSEVVAPIKRASFPAFSKLVDDREKLEKTYLELVAVLVLAALPMATGVYLTSDLLVYLLLGAQWSDAIPLIGLLAIYGIIDTIGSQTRPLFMAMNRPHVPAYLMTCNAAFFVPVFYFGMVKGGLFGAAYAVVLSSAVFLLVDVFVVRRIAGIKLKSVVLRLWRPVLASTIMFIVVHWYRGTVVSDYNDELSLLFELLVSAVIGTLTYIATVGVMWRLSGMPEGAESIVTRILASGLRKFRLHRK